MKYKVGDKVRVRGDLEVGKIYRGIKFLSDMEKNKIFDVLFVTENGACELNDVHRFYYSSEMLRPAEFKIWCETEEEKQAVLEELEKEGYVWRSGREKPTEPTYIGFFGKKPCGLYIQNDELGWGDSKRSFRGDNRVGLTPYEFTGIDFSEKIIIAKTPTGATATYGDKTVTAEGEFEDASRQALAEVLCPFRVGDRVCVKGDEEIAYKVESIKVKTEVGVSRTSLYSGGTWLAEALEPCTEPSYNAKLFCIEGHGVFKQGVVYTVENGIFIGVHDSHFEDLEDINKNLVSQFMEVKGGLDE